MKVESCVTWTIDARITPSKNVTLLCSKAGESVSDQN